MLLFRHVDLMFLVYLGCFSDPACNPGGSRDMNGTYWGVQTFMTVEACIGFCAAAGYPYLHDN